MFSIGFYLKRSFPLTSWWPLLVSSDSQHKVRHHHNQYHGRQYCAHHDGDGVISIICIRVSFTAQGSFFICFLIVSPKSSSPLLSSVVSSAATTLKLDFWSFENSILAISISCLVGSLGTKPETANEIKNTEKIMTFMSVDIFRFSYSISIFISIK